MADQVVGPINSCKQVVNGSRGLESEVSGNGVGLRGGDGGVEGWEVWANQTRLVILLMGQFSTSV